MPSRRRLVFVTVLVTVLALLHGLPWLVLILAPGWPTAVTVVAGVLLVGAALGFPFAMWQGHGAHHRDRFAIIGDVWLGVVWQLFAWSIVAGLVELVAALAGADRTVIRWIAGVALLWIAGLLIWGHRQ